MPRTRINGVELYHEIAGTDGPPLVLVHGSWGDHRNWGAVVPLLARSFRVLTYDRRGHSQSERPAGQGSVDDDTADLAALIEAAGFAPAHVAGNSGGSAVVLRLACARPDLFRSLVVHEPALGKLLAGDAANAPVVAAVRERIERVATLLAAGEMERGARLFVDDIAIGAGAWDKLPAAMRETFVFNAPTFLDECRDPGDSTMDLGGLARFDRPALLTQGQASPPMFSRILDLVAKAMPRAQRKAIPGAGHVPHVSHPAAYVDLVAAFVRAADDVRIGT